MEHGIGTAAQTSDLTESQQWIESLHDRALRTRGKSSVTKRSGSQAWRASLRARHPHRSTNRQSKATAPVNVTDANSSWLHGSTANRRLL